MFLLCTIFLLVLVFLLLDVSSVPAALVVSFVSDVSIDGCAFVVFVAFVVSVIHDVSIVCVVFVLWCFR